MRGKLVLRCAFSSLTFTLVLQAAAPVVKKVEPPDWDRAPHRQNVLVLLHGEALKGASVDCGGNGWDARSVEVNPQGTYAIFELSIPPDAQPAARACRLKAQGGSTQFSFTVRAPLSSPSRFRGFSNEDVIYQLMPDRFANGDTSNDDPAISRGLYNRANRRSYHGGDLAGVRAHLPYLQALGVTALWMTPIYDNANQPNLEDQFEGEQMTSYHGYGAVDFYGLEEHFGTLAEYQSLVENAHHLGISMIQDQVANHIGSQHPWMSGPPRADWIHGTQQDHISETWQTWLLRNPAHSPLLRGVLDGWFAPSLPDLNQDDPLLARYLIQNSIWWIARTGADGIREDTAQYVPRTFWRAWTGALHSEFPLLSTVGEVFERDPAQTSFFQGGRPAFDGVNTGFTSVFDFPLYFSIRDVFACETSPIELARLLAHDSLYPHPELLVTMLGLHDTARFRSHACPSKGEITFDDLSAAFTFLLTTRGIPMIYAGDEIGMSGGDDPENRLDFPGGWPGDPANKFEAAGRSPEEQRLWSEVQRLIKLRHSSPALRRGQTVVVVADEHTFAYRRVYGSERILVVLHHGSAAEARQVASKAASARPIVCLAGCDNTKARTQALAYRE